MWLSYIIPLYNCGPWVADCLDSLLVQGLPDDEYEVIVVNDGSTDGGEKIVERYCRNHANFRLFNQENQGVSAARNRGMDEANGEYLCFVDADDRLLPNGLRTLQDCYLNNDSEVDMACYWSHTVDWHYSEKEWEHIRPHKELYCGTFLEYGNYYGFGWAVYRMIISRALLVRHHLRYRTCLMSEDVMFMIDLFMAAPEATIVSTNLDIYRYCVRKGSLLTRWDRPYAERVVRDLINLSRIVRDMETTSPYDSRFYEEQVRAWQRKVFTRLLSAGLPCSAVRMLLNECREAGFYPIDRPETFAQRVINFIICYPVFVFFLSIPFRYVFLPYVKPYIKRN